MTTTIRDDCTGFAATEPHDGRGLPGLTARFADLGGVLAIESVVESGTQLRGTLRIDPSELESELGIAGMCYPGQMVRSGDLLIVEDDPRLCQALGMILEGSAFQTHIATTAAAALAAIESAPVLVLVDLGLPDGDGVDLIRELVTRRPGLRVLVLTVASSPAQIVAAIQAGACGYLFKEDLGRRLLPAIDEALAGGAPMSSGAARSVLDWVRKDPTPAAEPNLLSPRELEVLTAIAGGHTYSETGASMDISEHTVRSHLRSIYDKLGASNKAEAVAIAMRNGWLRSLV